MEVVVIGYSGGQRPSCTVIHMRVCLIARRFYENNTHMQQFANALAARGDDVDVIAARRPGAPPRESSHGVTIYRIQERNIEEQGPCGYLLGFLRFLFHAAAVVARLHLKRRYDLIHVQSVPDMLVLAALVPRMLGSRVILDFRDLVPELYASKFNLSESSGLFRTLQFVERICVCCADHVIVANPLWLDRVVSRSAPSSKCSMLWYSPDPAVFRPRSKDRRDGKFVIMYPGSVSWHQGVDLILRAMSKLLRFIPEAELHIYAEGPGRKRLAELADLLGVAGAVRFFDFVPISVLVDRMANSDLAVVPKRASDRFGNEAASTKIPEFMALGIPVVASRTDIEEQFFDDSEVCFFRSEDEDDLVRAVVAVYSDPTLQDRLRTNATNKLHGGARKLREHYLTLVDSIVSGRANETDAAQTLKSP